MVLHNKRGNKNMKIIAKIQFVLEGAKLLAQEKVANSIFADTKAEVPIMYIIYAVIAFYVLAALVPDAITTFKGANTTVFSSGEVAMWGLIVLMFIVSLVMMFIGTIKQR